MTVRISSGGPWKERFGYSRAVAHPDHLVEVEVECYRAVDAVEAAAARPAG